MVQELSQSTTSIIWQPPKQLQAHDKVWFLTDVQRELSRFLSWSEPQELFKVGAYDLTTDKIGFVRFGRDIAFALRKLGLPQPPWKAAAPFAVELHRYHHIGQEKGRYRTWASRVELEPALLPLISEARRRFAREGHFPNSKVGMWDCFEERASRENAIEQAALAMSGVFKAADVKAVVGKDINVSPILKRLLEEGRLVPASPKTYRVAPPKVVPVVPRLDWTD